MTEAGFLETLKRVEDVAVILTRMEDINVVLGKITTIEAFIDRFGTLEALIERFESVENQLRLHKPQNENSMNLDELKRRPRFKNCATDDDFLREIGLLETEAGKVPALDAEVTRLKGELKVFQDKADADDAAARKKLLDDAEQDGRIDAATRPIYENLLAKDRENGEKALEKLSPKRSVMTDLRVNPTGESPWNKRMSEIKDKLNHK